MTDQIMSIIRSAAKFAAGAAAAHGLIGGAMAETVTGLLVGAAALVASWVTHSDIKARDADWLPRRLGAGAGRFPARLAR